MGSHRRIAAWNFKHEIKILLRVQIRIARRRKQCSYIEIDSCFSFASFLITLFNHLTLFVLVFREQTGRWSLDNRLGDRFGRAVGWTRWTTTSKVIARSPSEVPITRNPIVSSVRSPRRISAAVKPQSKMTSNSMMMPNSSSASNNSQVSEVICTPSIFLPAFSGKVLWTNGMSSMSSMHFLFEQFEPLRQSFD